MKKKITLRFPADMTGKPVSSLMIRKYDVDFNILQAHVRPGMQGELTIEISGNDENVAQALEFLIGEGITVVELSHYIVWDSGKCTHCGCCTAVCPTGALKLDESAQLSFNQEECMVCEACVTACPLNTLAVNYE